MKRAAKKKPFNLILLGDPDAGKATQAARLVARYHLRDFDMGRELMRPAIRAQFDYKKTKARGALTPTWVVRAILHRVIPAVPRTQGILFDGHPKMIGEAKLVARLLKEAGRTDPLVVYLDIPRSEVLRRAGKRGRDDDTREALERRRRYYRGQMRRVVRFFRGRYEFRRISGEGTPTAVWKRINNAVKSYVS